MIARVVSLSAFLVAVTLLMYSASIVVASPPKACVHGISSIGPVVLKDGKVIVNSKPNTRICLP